jgi:hypothetical protein
MGLRSWLSGLFGRRGRSEGQLVPQASLPPPEARPHCHDCGVAEGERHALFCTMERCPWCGGQLAGCRCIVEVLRLDEAEQRAVDKYHDDTVEPLRTIVKRWEEALEQKGRVPFIIYPNVCAKCGSLWPEFFQVSNDEWCRYIQPDMRDQIICRKCFDYIRALTDSLPPHVAKVSSRLQ